MNSILRTALTIQSYVGREEWECLLSIAAMMRIHVLHTRWRVKPGQGFGPYAAFTHAFLNATDGARSFRHLTVTLISSLISTPTFLECHQIVFWTFLPRNS